MTDAGLVRWVGAAAMVAIAGVRPALADWTVGGFLGGAWTQSTSLTLRLPSEATDVTLSPVHYDAESLEAPIYYGYRVGFFPGSGWLGIEAEFIHLKVVADTARTTHAAGRLAGETVARTVPLSSVVDRFSITHGVNLLLANGVVRRAGPRRAGTPWWIATGRVGAGASIPHAESMIGGRRLEGYEWGALSLQASAGLEVRVAGGVFAMGEYKLTRTVQDVAVAGGTARTPLTTHHLVAGLVFHVGGPGRTP